MNKRVEYRNGLRLAAMRIKRGEPIGAEWLHFRHRDGLGRLGVTRDDLRPYAVRVSGVGAPTFELVGRLESVSSNQNVPGALGDYAIDFPSPGVGDDDFILRQSSSGTGTITISYFQVFDVTGLSYSLETPFPPGVFP